MTQLFEKSIRTLELPKVLERLAEIAVSPEGKRRCLALTPETDVDDVRRLQDQTDSARDLIGIRGAPSFGGVVSVGEALGRADRGGSLNPSELLAIGGVLRTARRVREYADHDDVDTGALHHLFASLHGNRFLEEKIFHAIVDENTIADGASPELSDIRRHIRQAQSKSRQVLQKIIGSSAYAKVLQEAIITQRDGRFVVPVKAEHKGDLPGLVHDISSSGATVFVEPMAVVQANNEVMELQAKERKEIQRILAELSADVAGCEENILWDYDQLVHLDVIFARGELSYKLNAGRPEIRTDGGIYLKKARHPLLDSKTAVPIDVELGTSFDTLVVTGPNTGGKTVTLKTLGLLTLMAQCGLHIPAGSGSSISVYGSVLADIGDEQSIQQSLSTFSAHMVNIVGILAEADSNSMVLFDELGAGTDPIEGAALAIAIIEDVRKLGAKIAATTHYAELKTFAMTTVGVENASCEFDVETLRPTYRLLIGIPGKSNAFAISQRLGLPEWVIDSAKEQMHSDSVRFEDVLTQLEEKRQALDKQQMQVDRLLRQKEEDARRAKEYRTQMERARDNARGKGEVEAKRLIKEAREQVDQAFVELAELRKRENKEGANQAKIALRKKLNDAEAAAVARKFEPEPIPKPSRPIVEGDLVEIPGVRHHAEVMTVNKDGTLQLKAGAMKMKAKAEDVRLIEQPNRKQRKAAESIARSKGVVEIKVATVSSDLDIRGMETMEAEPVVERFLDAAHMGHMETVTIIHGKGTGALRAAVHQMLRRHHGVKEFRLGVYGEGENGVTVVKLK